MIAYENEVRRIQKQIEEFYQPQEIYVFGSCAKGVARKNSDIDLCVIMETENKHQAVREMFLKLDYERDLDLVVYTPQEWYKYKQDKTTFAHVIFRTGVKLSG